MLVLELGTLARQGHAGLRRGRGYGAAGHRHEWHGCIKYLWSPPACVFLGKRKCIGRVRSPGGTSQAHRSQCPPFPNCVSY